MEYSNLIGEIAKTLGVTRDTLRNKLNGKREFTITEAFAIKNSYFPNISFEQLFPRES